MKKGTRFFRPLLSLLLLVAICTVCLSALTGESFALLKDLLSRTNVIKSGVLEVDFEVRQSNGEYLSVRKNDIPILNYDKWEPGYTQVLNARIVNSGNLSLSYELEVLATGIVEAMLNNKPILSDVIEVYYASGEVLMGSRTEFEDAIAGGQLKHLGNLTQLLLSRTLLKDCLHPVGSGTPDEDSADYVTFVFQMHSAVPLSYQGLTVGEEGFEFNLYASQYTHETDSFDNSYDISKVNGYLFDDGQVHEVDTSVILTEAGDSTDCIIADGEGTVVNIRGGHFDSIGKDCAVWAKNGAVVNIYGGTFFCNGTGKSATPTEHQTLIYAGEGGTVNIFGGYFASRTDGTWLLDEKDPVAPDVGGSITVYGGTYKDWNPADNDSNGPATNYLASGTSILASQKGSVTFYSINDAKNALYTDKEGDMSLVGDLTIMDVPLYHNPNITEPTTINGNGYTVEFMLYEDNPELGNGGWYPNLSTLFTAPNGSEVVVNDLTFTGTSHLIAAGDYRTEARNTAVTVFNNVSILDMELIQFSKWCTALNTCGTATLNNCRIYGSTRSPLDANYGNPDASPAYDLVVSNACKTYINGGEVGRIYLDNSSYTEIRDAVCDTIYTEAQNKAYLKVGGTSRVKLIKVERQKKANVYIEDQAVIDELDLTPISKSETKRITVADTATVKKITDGEHTFSSLEEWKTWKATT